MKIVQIRRGTQAEVDLITPAHGEMLFAYDTGRFSIGDGSTAGGIPSGRLKNLEALVARNALGTANVDIIKINASDLVELGALDDVVLANDKVVIVEASGVGTTELMQFKDSTGLVATVATSDGNIQTKIKQAGKSFRVMDSVGFIMFDVKDNGIITGPSAIPTDITTGAINGRVINSAGVLYQSRNSTGLENHTRFHNPNGNVGAISTSGTATLFTTSSDPRLKKIKKMWDDAKINSEYEKAKEACIVFGFIGDPDKEVLGFNAHDLIDADLACGGGVEGEGPRDMELGEVYKTTQEDSEVQQLIVDEEGEAILLDGEEQYKTVTVKKDVEHKVTPAGVDQSKLVPLLLLKIDQHETRLDAQDKRIDDQDALIASLIKRMDDAGIA